MLSSKKVSEKEKLVEDLPEVAPDSDNVSVEKKKKKKSENAKPQDKVKKFSGKICKLSEKDFKGKKLKSIKKSVENPKYICLVCGRAASKKSNLCKPEKI